ncbi:MAG: RNA-binding S4 domain-containing protein [Acidimicrobiales bacterium]
MPPASPGQEGLASARVDKWLWAVRLYKTRTEATDACRAGHVEVNGVGAKAATLVKRGDQVEARSAAGERAVEVTRVLDKRVGAAIAAACYVDHSPPPAPEEAGVVNFARQRGAGRPTKRDRRQLDRARRR